MLAHPLDEECGSLKSGDTTSVFTSSYDVSGLPGSTYDLYRNELNNYSNASAMLIDLPMMTSRQATSLAGNSAYAGYALHTAILSGRGSATGVAQITVEDLRSGIIINLLIFQKSTV